ncbi:internal head protein [Pseudomonas phage 201phi2-1]|uniref:Virion structural protein n=1 Tax=Pseudomonas phage 201phi2-1 TaxID=198110 RepID=B3FJA8_BP201|nr:internal head protein [Pseudomonas phage 201phi2-1]ABY63074.1 virion structural protein [Pseudomonas phage 201phi2-1]
MSRVKLFDFIGSIANESVSHDAATHVEVNTKNDLPKNVQEDTDKVEVDKDVSADATNTKTSEPGPKDGGGDGTAEFHSAEKAATHMKVGDVAKNIDRDQNGGRDIDTLPNKVNAKDGLSSSDISTSVEEHSDKVESESEATELESMDASGAEEVGAADDMIVDLDSEEMEISGLTEATDKGLSVADAAFAKVDELNKGVASIERYIEMLDRIDRAGREFTPELRQSISWGLESIDGELFFDERVALESCDPSARVSLEATGVAASGAREGTIDDGEDPGEVSKGLSAKLKKLVEASIRMFWRAVNAVVDIFNHMTGDMKKIRDHLSDLRSKAKVLDGGKEFKMKGAHRLMVGDEFVGDGRQAVDRVTRVANELLIAWPNQLGKIVQKWGQGRRGAMSKTEDGHNNHINEARLKDEFADAIRRSFRDMQALSPNDRDKVPSGFLGVDKLMWSGPLAGNRALYIGTSDGGKDMKGAINFSFSAIPGESTHAGEITVETPTAGEAIAIIRELEKMTHFIDDAKQGMNTIKKVYDGIFGDSIERFSRTVASTPQMEEYYRGGDLALTVSRVTFDANREFLGYMTSMVKAYIGFISASMKAEGGGEQGDIEGSATRVD